jgi:FkbM family methyltransferase
VSFHLEKTYRTALGRYTDQAGRKRSVKDTAELLHLLAAHVQPELCLEVGARQATFSRRCVRDYPDARVIALEANPYVFEHFGPGLPAGVEYLNVAATQRDAAVTFRVQRQVKSKDVPLVLGSNSLNLRQREDVTYEEVRVRGRALDSLLQEKGLTGRRSVMWVDVEGAQREVLDGGSATFAAAELVLIEVERTPLWQGQMLEDAVNARLESFGLVPISMDLEFWPDQHNILYARASRTTDEEFCEIVRTYQGRPS